MHSRQMLKAVAAIFVAFAVGLVFYFIFSAAFGDGLEKTMENAGVEEQKPVYTAPLSYGDNYHMALVMGIVGFAAVLGCAFLFGKLLTKKPA
jgi:hypothetical protein